ncbi:MAG: T9SS type A sorting domain-containing protein, partial [Bergeyella zoohelcum]|nr:T9SS type A sorting domain-containing protein [Bergeyella zoohelcum]
KLKSLDLSKNTALISLFSSNNSLVQLNLANGNNKNMSVDATKNPSLTCIQTDSDFRASRAWRKDSTASYNENCNYPKLSIQDTKNIEFLEILNPVRNTLIINTTAKIEKIEIYNAMGQLVKVVQKDNLQVSDLAKGIYITKIITNNNIITKKIVKE